jgi:DNA repair exonuclease SbcCD ATPase subunit
MQCTKLMIGAAVLAAYTAAGCSPSQPPAATTDEATPAETAAATAQKEIAEETSRMEERLGGLEREWSEKEKQITDKTRTATAGLREEVREDVKNVREAVADLKTTSAENWWERHERAMERTAADIEQDVKRLAPKMPAPAAAAEEATTGTTGFEARRDRFVTRLRSRVDAMEKALEAVKADGARATEVKDTRARVDKLKEDLDRLRGASADDWWDISRRRVTEYIDRVEGSIRRLDDNKT